MTLLDTMIVVVIIAIISGAAIPHYVESTLDAKRSSLEHNLHTIQSMIELYRATHAAASPQLIDNALPQLTRATNSSGDIGTAGPLYPYGPYIVLFPPNAFDNSDHVAAVAVAGVTPAGVSGNLGGWQYDETTGSIWPNNAMYFVP